MNRTVIKEFFDIVFKPTFQEWNITDAHRANFAKGLTRFEKGLANRENATQEENFLWSLIANLGKTESLTHSNLPDIVFRSLSQAKYKIDVALSERLNTLYKKSKDHLDAFNQKLEEEKQAAIDAQQKLKDAQQTSFDTDHSNADILVNPDSSLSSSE